MVSPAIHLVKNPVKKQGAMLGPLCNQTVNLEADVKTLYFSLLKLNIVLLYI